MISRRVAAAVGTALVLLLMLTLVGWTGVPTAIAAPGEPASLAVIGDSITRGTNAFGWYGDHPSYSWSTGFNPLDGLHSHYERLLGRDRGIWGDELNVAESGARMADAPAQAAEVVAEGADYVTILMGANDLCAASVDQMTTVEEFRTDFEVTMRALTDGLDDARILVASIPNVLRLRLVFADNPVARFVWRTSHACQSVLSEGNAPLERLEVLRRSVAFNVALADVCSRYANCRFDGYAVFNHPFTQDEVSRLDFFHPSLDGQNALASLTWTRSWWA